MDSTITFTQDGIEMIKSVAARFLPYESFHDYLESYALYDAYDIESLYDTSSFNTLLSLRLSLYVVHNHDDYISLYVVNDHNPNKIPINSAQVVIMSGRIVQDVIEMTFEQIPPAHDNAIMMNGYPEHILEHVCSYNNVIIERHNIHAVKECLKRIEVVWKVFPTIIPKQVYNMMDSRIPLAGHPQSPLTQKELESICMYIGIKKHSRVTLLLNCLEQMASHSHLLKRDTVSEHDLFAILESGWLFVLMVGILCHIPGNITLIKDITQISTTLKSVSTK